MIKVIASDMDGTLLGNDHKVAPETVEVIREACDAGIRFMIATGRNFSGAMTELKDIDLRCDYIVSSGAEVRNPQQEVVERHPMDMEVCRRIYDEMQEFPVSLIFSTDSSDYRVGKREEVEESIIRELMMFHVNMTREEVLETSLYRHIKESGKIVPDMSELVEQKVPVYKLFIFSENVEMLGEIQKKLGKFSEIAVASSFDTNLEITDVQAQKGPVLKHYIESLGYTRDEVMVLGDSLNDMSMIEMDFGATVAMENADPAIKAAAKYVTKSNEELGVAHAIREVLRRRGEDA